MGGGALSNLFGLVIGRSLLFSPGDDVAGAIDRAVELPEAAGSPLVRSRAALRDLPERVGVCAQR
jgi:hypothetical protein